MVAAFFLKNFSGEGKNPLFFVACDLKGIGPSKKISYQGG